MHELDFDGMLLKSATVPHCLLSTLKVLKFENFCDSRQLLFIANFFYRKWSGFGED